MLMSLFFLVFEDAIVRLIIAHEEVRELMHENYVIMVIIMFDSILIVVIEGIIDGIGRQQQSVVSWTLLVILVEIPLVYYLGFVHHLEVKGAMVALVIME